MSPSSHFMWISILAASAFPVFSQNICIFESAAAPNTSDVERSWAEIGCRNSAGCLETFPLISFGESDTLESTGVFSACDSSFGVVACNSSKRIGRSLYALLHLPMYRTYVSVGLESESGWWTNSNTRGNYQPAAFIDPQLDMFALGEQSAPDGEKTWLCVCVQL